MKTPTFIFSFPNSLSHTTPYNLLYFQIYNVVNCSGGHLFFKYIAYSLIKIWNCIWGLRYILEMYQNEYINIGGLFESELIKYFASKRMLWLHTHLVPILWAVANAWDRLVSTIVKLQSSLMNSLHPIPRSLCHPSSPHSQGMAATDAFSILRICLQLLHYLVFRWSNSSCHLWDSPSGQDMWKVWCSPWLWPMPPTEGGGRQRLERLTSVLGSAATCSLSLDCGHALFSLHYSIQSWFSLLKVQGVGAGEESLCLLAGVVDR